MTGIIEITREVPDSPAKWSRVLKRINDAIKIEGETFVLGALTTIAERTGTPLTELLALIGNDGRATTQAFMPLINFANAGSVQSIIPLSSSADASVATINIAAHDVIYGGETISYAAGAVLGAPVNTDVHIYADDPDLDGGAVTYEFTTDYTDLAGSKHRYRVGAIRTPVSSISAAVSAVTNANPCAVTTGASHNFTTGDVVDFSGVGGTTELNTGTYPITVTSPTSFTLNGTDSTGFGVYTSGGTATRVSTPADGIGGAGGSYDVYDPGYFYP